VLRAAGCVFAEEEAALLTAAAGSPEELDALVARRVAGHPLEYVLGWAEFCGLRIAVDPGVFVPRRRTVFLVDRAVAGVLERRRRSGDDAPPPVVVDLCCGSGAIGVAIATVLGGAELHAVDVEPSAVRCARRNVAALGGRVYEGDLFEPLPERLRGRVDLLTANVPYVPTEAMATMPPEARLYEPRVALDGGPDGLDVVRRLVQQAPEWLAPGGRVLFETSEVQAPVAVDVVVRSGLTADVVRSPELYATVVIGTLG
jgi:release factor glutamine methyltransferase